MFENEIKAILETYYEEYKNIFKIFDFSADRFTEENQTVNFCRAVQKECEGALVWYEYPWENEKIKKQRKSKSRFDAVIYLPKEKALIIVESKCLRHKRKYEAMYKDLERIIDKNNNVKIKNEIKPKTVYAVILADYWSKGEKSQYHNLQTYWKKDADTNALKQDKNKLFDEFVLTTKNLENPNWNCSGELIENKNYFLLSVIGKIK